MVVFDPQAIALNEIIKKNHGPVFDLLSRSGQAFYFPKKGILAQAAQARGKSINATIGIALEENSDPMSLSPLADKINLPLKEVFPYAPSYGVLELRELWQERVHQNCPSLSKALISLPIVTSGLTHGLSLAGSLFLNEGDVVVSPDLYWENYSLTYETGLGACIETFTTFKDRQFNLEGLKQKVLSQAQQKVTLILNFPNNPSGYTLSESEVEKLERVLLELVRADKKLLVIIDDAYFGLVYKKGIYRDSIFGRVAMLHENIVAVKVDGATKEDYAWGFRVGFITFGVKGGTPELYQALEAKAAGIIRGTISNASRLSQGLLFRLYQDSKYQSAKTEKKEILKKRAEKVFEILERRREEFVAEFESIPFNSGYFMCVIIKNGDAEKVRQHLLEKYSIGLIAFGNVLRVAFSSTPLNQLEALFDGLYRACQEISQGK
jgi:aspartate/methionine/tyrosine aminotransferase